jgi:citrate synthase
MPALTKISSLPLILEVPSQPKKGSPAAFFTPIIEKVKSIFRAFITFLSSLCCCKKEPKVLFAITSEHLDTGLRGFPVGYCSTSHVDPVKGIFYAGKPIKDLATRDPVEVIYLLYHGKEGTKSELEKFSQELQQRAKCSPQVLEHIKKLPCKGDPMKLLPSALSILGIYEGTGNYREDCLNVIAKMPHLTAALMNHHAGWGDTPEPKPELGYMENFVHMLQMPNKKEKELAEVFRLFNVLHFDHGGGNLSTFVGKAVSSGQEDMYGSLASSMHALAGPLHGRANQDCLKFVKEILAEAGENASGSDIEKLIRNRLKNKQLIFGFGHAVLRVEDPRAAVQFDYAKKHFPDHPLVKIALLLRKEGTKVLMENPKVSSPFPNVDAISGSLLTAAGFDYPQYYTVLFGLSRAVGIAIQIAQDRCDAREGKGTPIVRPDYLFRPRSGTVK